MFTSIILAILIIILLPVYVAFLSAGIYVGKIIALRALLKD